jgi:CBS domain containing-hemolysin-like protein
LIFELALTIMLVAGNAFFVATEFAVTRMRPTQVDDLERDGRTGSRSVRHAVDHIDAYLAACQLGITITSLGIGVVGERAFAHLLEPVFGEATRILSIPLAGAVAFAIITLLHVVVGELSPKSLAIARAEPTALAVAAPMRAFYLLTRPIVDLFNWLGNLLLKPFGIPPAREAGHAPVSEDELRTLVRESSEQGLIDPHEQRFADNVFSFGDRRTREIMVPRPEVAVVLDSETADDAARRGRDTGYTRFPLCQGDGGLDSAIGLLHMKDVLTAGVQNGNSELRSLARPLPRISDATLVDELLRELRRGRQHMALVVDEHGTAVGIVTLEDVLEEIVGEIEDEFDPPGAELVRYDDGVLVIQGAAPLRLAEDALDVDLSDAREATIGGHVVEALGRLPSAGEVIELAGREVDVTKVGEAQVEELRAQRPAADEKDGPEATEGSHQSERTVGRSSREGTETRPEGVATSPGGPGARGLARAGSPSRPASGPANGRHGRGTLSAA